MTDVHTGDFAESVRSASVDEYKKWLLGYIANGGEPTHYYDYPFSRHDFKVLTSDGAIPTLHGANAVRVIVPPGVNAVKQGGHNDVYYMDGYRTDDIVPVYADIIEDVVYAAPHLFDPPRLSGLEMKYLPACVACDWEGGVTNTQSEAEAACDDHILGYGEDHLQNIGRVLVTESGERLKTYY